MKIDILTLFPEMLRPMLSGSILGRAVSAGLLDVQLTNIRDYTENKHRCTDDYPFGGGAGMVMFAQPIVDAVRARDPEHCARRIYLSPRGRTLTQRVVEELAQEEALLLLCIVWLIWERKKAPSPIAPKLNPLDFPVAIFLTVCFVLLCVVCPYLSIQIAGFRATCQYLLWFYLVTRLIRNDRDCMTLYLTLVALSFVLSLHGIYQYITKAPMPASWVAQAETAVRTRVYSIFGSPNIMGDFMVMFVPMTAALAYYAEKPKYKVLAWVAAFSMCFACLFTMSRGAWVAMALAIVLFILLVDRRLFLPLAAGLVLLVLVPFVRTRIGFLFTQDFVDANTNGGRGGRWALGLELLEANGVWTGVGHGMFGGAVAVQNKVLDYIQYFYIDNYYLKTMVETGYLGLGAFILMQLGMIVTSCRSICRTGAQWKAKQSRNYPLVVGMFCGLCGVLVHCFFENIFEEPYMMVYFWAIAAMIVYFGFLRKPQEVST